MRKYVPQVFAASLMLPLPAMASDFSGMFTFLGFYAVLAPLAVLHLVLLVAFASSRRYVSPRFARIHAAVGIAPLVPWLLLAYADLGTRQDGGDLAIALLLAGLLFALACLPLAAHYWQRATRPALSTRGIVVRAFVASALLYFFTSPAIAHYHLVQRQAFWKAELDRVDYRSTFPVVRDAMSRLGLHLVCQPRDATGITYCIADDPRGFGLLPNWRITITATFTEGTLLSIDQSAEPRPF